MSSFATPEERKSTGPLFAYIDLLFLIVCFFIVLLHLAGKDSRDKESQLSQITREMEVVKETVAKLQPLADAALNLIAEEEEKKRLEEERQKRKLAKSTTKVSFRVKPGGIVVYSEREYTAHGFADEIVKPARKNSWIAFRSYAQPQTPFGDVIKVRSAVLRHSGEFDTYWSNLARN